MGWPAPYRSEREPKVPGTLHSVTITRAFCMKATEVTQSEWTALMGSNPASKECGSNCPVETVSWDDVVGYANALSLRDGLPECYTGSTLTGLDCTGYRLPTESEWEYAARAGQNGDEFGGGQSMTALPHPVGQNKPNAWGLYDLRGNVSEWTGDWYAAYGESATDPTGAPAGSTRAVRGGGWEASARDAYTPDLRHFQLGFRLVKTAP
jgi:formylglycine-generating enzyme required for sulfatase activity